MYRIARDWCRSGRTVSVVALTLLLGAATVAAQGGRFEDVTEVVLVEVPVQVLKDGEPVRGLTVDDFRISEGRKKRDIVGFEMVDLTLTDATGDPLPLLTTSARRHFLFLFDLSFSDPGAIVRAREAAIELVETSLHPSDLTAVSTYSRTHGAQLVLGFTPDRNQVRQAIQTLGLPQLVESRRDPLGLTFQDPRELPTAPPPGGGRVGVDVGAEIQELLEGMETASRAADQRNEILSLTGSMTNLAEMMKSVSGRKHVVFLSEGFDSSIVLGVGTTTSEERTEIYQTNETALTRPWEVNSDERFGNTSTQNQLTLMLDEFVRADCAIQAVDIGGLRAGPDVRQQASGQEGLFMMADQTGGELFSNYNNLNAAMGKMLERTSVTYVLAFQPEDLAFDGKFHKIKVELKDGPKGAQLVHRPGYYAPRSYAETNSLERGLAGASAIFSAPGGLVRTDVFAAPFNVGRDRAYVPVLIEVDGPSLLAGTAGNVLPTEIYAYAIAVDGGVRDFFTQTLGLDRAKVEPALQQSGFKYWGHFDLPQGNYAIRVLIRNGQTGASGVDVSTLRVPDFSLAEPAFLPPLFPEPAGKWLLGREQEMQAGEYPYPFMIKDTPFIPAARPIVRAGQAAAVALVTYNFSGAVPDTTGVLFGADGKRLGEVEIVLDEQELGDDPSMVRYAGTCTLPAIGAGEYRLEVTLKDSETGDEQTSSIEVRVEA